MQEPVVTWNLFLTAVLVPLSVGVLGFVAKRWITAARDGWEKYESEKQKNQEEWKARISGTLCQVKTNVDDIKYKLTEKVGWDKHDEMSRQIHDMNERLAVNEVGLEDMKETCRRHHG